MLAATRTLTDYVPALIRRQVDGPASAAFEPRAARLRGAVLFADRLHPSPAGYALIGDTWYSAIGPLLR